VAPRPDGAGSFTNDDLLPWLRRFPNRLIGMAHIRVVGEPEGADAVQRWYDAGFRGLKLICPDAPYDHPKYFPIYERAQLLRMPILFHTGWVAVAPPGSPANQYVRSEYMRPWHLDHLARRFPELRILG
ncbi:MAG: amidohydrolase family protein, partial [Armatimonadota bacterium]|nr:amidohydrolase family protein [Armatimonadota bacterium]